VTLSYAKDLMAGWWSYDKELKRDKIKDLRRTFFFYLFLCRFLFFQTFLVLRQNDTPPFSELSLSKWHGTRITFQGNILFKFD
jgi:hypothetical protein